MRLALGLIWMAAIGASALAQTPPRPAAPPARPPASTGGPYTTKLPEAPAGQWGEGILKDAKTQSFEGEDYAAVDFERLQEHVDALCHYDKAASIIGKPVATIATYRQNMGWPALVDGRQVEVFRTPNEDGKMILPFIFVDVTNFLTDVRDDPYFRACGGINFRVCTVALYGRFEWREAKQVPDWGADMLIGDKKCVFSLEHYRKMGLVDYGGAVGKMTLDEFSKGIAPKPGKVGP